MEKGQHPDFHALFFVILYATKNKRTKADFREV